MKEKIYTIPINEAFDKDCECPICEFEKNEEQKIIEYMVGASMMEPDCREITNEKGFCKHHYMKILETPNKLSIALINQTHMAKILKDLKNNNEKLPKSEKKLFKKSDALKDELDMQINAFYKLDNSCAVCDKLENIMDSFMDNLIYLYQNSEEFKEKFLNSKGFCIKHFNLILEEAKKSLSGKELYDFCKKLYEIEIENFSRVLDDVNWFVKKFDYRYKDADWKNSKDAVQRSICKIVSYKD